MASLVVLGRARPRPWMPTVQQGGQMAGANASDACKRTMIRTAILLARAAMAIAMSWVDPCYEAGWVPVTFRAPRFRGAGQARSLRHPGRRRGRGSFARLRRPFLAAAGAAPAHHHVRRVSVTSR
jgi:hypothetical protein